LRQAGHDVETPVSARTLGRSDVAQMTFAVHGKRICLTANYKDYDELHLLIREVQGAHSGILVIRQDNDRARDMTPKGIVAAIRNIVAAGVAIENDYIVLNHWR
jgi:hypothetical protein